MNKQILRSLIKRISEGETIVVERVTPNPATVAKLVVTKDMLK